MVCCYYSIFLTQKFTVHPLKLVFDNCSKSVRVMVSSSLEVLAVHTAGSLLTTFVAQFMMSDRASRCSSEVRLYERTPVKL